jgi:hypothetical protein
MTWANAAGVHKAKHTVLPPRCIGTVACDLVAIADRQHVVGREK